MGENKITGSSIKDLDSLKHETEAGVDYWFARDLQVLLGYSDWDNFLRAIERAKTSCRNMGINPDIYFYETTTTRTVGSGAKRKVVDIALTRLACYLIAINAASSKEEVAKSHGYFVDKTYAQEQFEKFPESVKRMIVRERVKNRNNDLRDTANNAGVVEWGLFYEAGHKGLYGGIGSKQVKRNKGIPEKESILDYIGHEELAIHEFKATQTTAKLKRDKIHGDKKARDTHENVAKEIRKTIKNIGGTMPEDLPSEPSIKNLTKSKNFKSLPPSST